MRFPVFILIVTVFMMSGFIPSAPAGEWHSYTTDTSGIASNCISCMAISESGKKWFGHGDAGTISSFDGVSWHTFPLPTGLPVRIVNDIAVAGETVWVATDYGICSFNGLSWRTYFLDFFRFRHLETDTHGNVWVTGFLGPSSQATISMFDGTFWITWLLDSESAPRFTFGSSNTLWLLTDDFTLWRYIEPKWKRFPGMGITPDLPFVADHDTTLWFPEGISFDGSSVRTEGSLKGSPIGVDGGNTIWYSTGGALLAFNPEKNAAANYTMPEALRHYEAIRYGAVDRDGSIWLHASFDVTVGVRHFIPDNPSPLHSRKAQAFPTIGRALTAPVTAARKSTVDYFPLDVGNIWIYEREFTAKGQLKQTFMDHLVLTVVDTIQVDNRTWALFLDGTIYRKDDQDKVHSGSGLLYDLSQPYIDNYTYRSDYCIPLVMRTNATFKVPLGDIPGLSFDLSDGTSHSPRGLAPGIGLVYSSFGSDIGEKNILKLEYARTGGREYGLRTTVGSETRPVSFRVLPPSPNPFNPSTSIRIELGAAGPVHIAIYTITGQKVATLCDAPLASGSHVFTWKPDRLAAGLYLYSVRVGGQVRTGKMLYLK